ncbi:MAG: hypothetical protein ABR529_14715 [Actinomycetota bacterium]
MKAVPDARRFFKDQSYFDALIAMRLAWRGEASPWAVVIPSRRALWQERPGADRGAHALHPLRLFGRLFDHLDLLGDAKFA